MTTLTASKLESGHILHVNNVPLTVLSTEPFGPSKKSVKLNVLTAEMAVFSLFAPKNQLFLVAA